MVVKGYLRAILRLLNGLKNPEQGEDADYVRSDVLWW